MPGTLGLHEGRNTLEILWTISPLALPGGKVISADVKLSTPPHFKLSSNHIKVAFVLKLLAQFVLYCWGWGECHPAVVNRNDSNCSMCPSADPSTWKDDDVHFEVKCKGDVGTANFQLDDLLETQWLDSLSLQLVYSTSNGENVREPVTAMQGTQEKQLNAHTQLCLSFDPRLSPTICGSCGTTVTTTSELL